MLVGEWVSSYRPRDERSCARLAKGHPFDLTKTRLQTAAPGTYTGAVDVVKQAMARDGVKGYASYSSFSARKQLRIRFPVSTVVSFLHY